MKDAPKAAAFFSVLWLSLSTLPACVPAQTQPATSGGQVHRFVNGQWFNGKTFRRQTFYAVDGVLTKKKPARVDETVDLEGGFVVPPFGEAHNHNLGGGLYLNRDHIRQMIRSYLDAGVFYVKIAANPGENSAILRRELVNRPDSVDVSFANAALTSQDGHPIGMMLASFKEEGIAAPELAELEGKSFYIIESERDLLAKWPRIVEGKPDFIKTILTHSENFAKRREDPKLFGFNGLDPQLLPLIVKQAHAAGLRVSTHVDSAADFAAAVRAGVDEINHLPGYAFARGTTEADYLITPQDAKRAAQQDIVVVTTTCVARFFAKDEALAGVQAAQRKNLRLLKQHGVRLAVGSDAYPDTSVEEAMYLKSLDVFGNAELLRMWTETAAQTIFPRRKIGRLHEGYEASFLVLQGNPLERFEHIKDIRLRFKQGVLINAAP